MNSQPHPNYVDAAKLRLDWALRRIDDFDRQATAFLDSRPFSITTDIYPYRPGYRSHRLTLRVDKPIPHDLGFLAADCVHNLRAVVDNLVWGCGCVVGAPKNLALSFPTATGFLTPDRYAKRISRLPNTVQKWIADQQPNAGRAGTSGLLYSLNQLCGFDKHRAPILVSSLPRRVKLAYRDLAARTPHATEIHAPGGLKDGDEVFSIGVSIDCEVDFEAEMIADVSFDEAFTPDHISARLFMREVHQHIRESVVSVFEPLVE